MEEEAKRILQKLIIVSVILIISLIINVLLFMGSLQTVNCPQPEAVQGYTSQSISYLDYSGVYQIGRAHV